MSVSEDAAGAAVSIVIGLILWPSLVDRGPPRMRQ